MVKTISGTVIEFKRTKDTIVLHMFNESNVYGFDDSFYLTEADVRELICNLSSLLTKQTTA